MTTFPRIHMGLAVSDVEKSLTFYRALLGVEPSKVKPGYAKLESDAPSINLTLNQTTEPSVFAMPGHFGVEVGSTELVAEANERMRAAGFATENEDGVTCCFAVQDKVWISDPDGHRWEVYVKLADAEIHSGPSKAAAPCCDGADAKAQAEGAEPCCEPSSAAPSSAGACCG